MAAVRVMVSVTIAGAGTASATVSSSAAADQPELTRDCPSDIGREPEHIKDTSPKGRWLADGDLIVDFGKKKNLTFREAAMDLAWVTWVLNTKSKLKSPQAKKLLLYLQRRYQPQATGAANTRSQKKTDDEDAP